MTWHMVVQMPGLVASGWILCSPRHAKSYSGWGASWNHCGLTGIVAAEAILTFWMLPVEVDRAVLLPLADAAKIGSLVITGALLRASIARAPAVLQLFFLGTTLPMLIMLGIYISGTDTRLCNAYSLESQAAGGWNLILLGIILAIASSLHIAAVARGESVPARAVTQSSPIR